jgi:hypothetical protein
VRPVALYLKKLAKTLGMMGSAHDNESLTAARKATAMVHAAGLQWIDFTEAYEQRFELLEVAKGLSDEVDSLRAEVARLRANGHPVGEPAGQLWQDAATVSNTARAARWALDHAHRMRWTPPEAEFLDGVTRHKGRLTERQQGWLDALLRRCTERTGEYPP